MLGSKAGEPGSRNCCCQAPKPEACAGAKSPPAGGAAGGWVANQDWLVSGLAAESRRFKEKGLSADAGRVPQ